MYEAQNGKPRSASRNALAQGMWPRFPGLSGATAVRMPSRNIGYATISRPVRPVPTAPAPVVMAAAAPASATAPSSAPSDTDALRAAAAAMAMQRPKASISFSAAEPGGVR